VRLLVTRPDPDGERTAENLRARGHAVMTAALLRIEAVAFALTGETLSGVVMTSANAARCLAGHGARAALTALPAFVVGRRTAEAARAVGFKDVRSADGARGDLVRLLAALPRRGPLLYLAGEDRAGELDLNDLPVRTVTAYRAVKLGHFPPPVVAALAAGELGGVLHFSRRSAQIYLDCAARDGILGQALAPVHLCLSLQVSEPLAQAGAAAIKVASRPEEAALLDLIGAP
jgi:uroporphyrinogen-III synthase